MLSLSASSVFSRLSYSILAVITRSQRGVKTEIVNTEPLPLGKNRIRHLWAFSHVFLNQPIHNLVLCVVLFKDTLFMTYCWLIKIELTANWMITWTELSLSKTHILFSIRHIIVFLHVDTQDRPSVLCVEVIFNSKITSKRCSVHRP